VHERLHETAALVLFEIILVACGLASSSALPTPASAATASTEALAPAVTQPSLCQPPSLANCYTDATMQSYIDKVLPMITQFFRAKYAAMPEPTEYYFIAHGQQLLSACEDEGGNPGLENDETYAYCPADRNVYLGQTTMWKMYNQDGDAAPAVGLAHEWGHNVQTQIGVPPPRTQDETIVHEDQADCIAGAWIQYADEQKWLEPEDVSSITRLVEDIASAEDNQNRTHGTLSERGAAMTMGLRGGLAACNRFYPETPIFTPSGG
jgi:predicted metalloprotease